MTTNSSSSPTQCRAKNPSTCRVHGSIQVALSNAINNNDVNAFISTRDAQPESVQLCDVCDNFVKEVQCSTCGEMECENCNKAYGCESNHGTSTSLPQKSQTSGLQSSFSERPGEYIPGAPYQTRSPSLNRHSTPLACPHCGTNDLEVTRPGGFVFSINSSTGKGYSTQTGDALIDHDDFIDCPSCSDGDSPRDIESFIAE